MLVRINSLQLSVTGQSTQVLTLKGTDKLMRKRVCVCVCVEVGEKEGMGEV